MSLLRTPAVVVLTALLAACERPLTSPSPLRELPRKLTAAEQGVIAASNTFAFGLLREVNRDETGENVFVSPLSASMALGMTMNGARGQTLDAMRGTLGFAQIPLTDVNRSYRGLIDLLRDLDPRVDMRIANSIWYREGYRVEQPFVSTTRQFFDAQVSALDFADPGAARTINSWVDKSTSGKISEIVDPPIPASVVMYLINAIYFKGKWAQPFDRGRTQDATFTGLGAAGLPVKMMNREGTYGYLHTPEAEIVDLPYGNGAFSMTIILPEAGRDVNALLGSMTVERWREWTGRLQERRIALFVPRFRLEYGKDLNDVLGALGMGIAFTPASDFTAMSASDPWIDLVFQKTFVEVNEEGTEAAAVTKVVMVDSLPPTVRVDRPFVFAIRERFSGAILFIGKIVRPEST